MARRDMTTKHPAREINHRPEGCRARIRKAQTSKGPTAGKDGVGDPVANLFEWSGL